MKSESGFAILTGLVYAAMLMVFATIVRGVVLTILWRWFMMPFGLPALGIAWAIGVGMTLNYLLGIETKEADNKDKSFGDLLIPATVKVIMTPAMVLLLGWLIHSYM